MSDKAPHKWMPSTLGHGEWFCAYCWATNREIAVIGDPNHCTARLNKDLAYADNGKGDNGRAK